MSFKKGAGSNILTYPFTELTLDTLEPCDLASPRIGFTHGLKIPDSFDIDEALIEVQEVRLKVEKDMFPLEFFQKYYPFEGGFPTEIPEPLANEMLSYDDPKGLANVVHMDLPTDMPFAVHSWLVSNGAMVKDFDSRYNNFLKTIPRSIEQTTIGTYLALEKSFEVKYFYGLDRPEEMFSNKTGIDPTLLTYYDEGCPTHPSYPAGHGAAAGGGIDYLLNQFKGLTEEQIKVALDCAYIWAMARTLAGVHYAIDNVAGLIVGGLGKYMKKETLNSYLLK